MGDNAKDHKDKPPMVGGVTDKDTDGIFNTSGSEPVRDRTPDESKGQPVKRFFTKDGTPVEPSSLKPEGTPYHLKNPTAEDREDVIEAWEYLDADGAAVTHDSVKDK